MIIACIIGGVSVLSTALLVVCCVYSGNISRQEEEKIKDLVREELDKK